MKQYIWQREDWGQLKWDTDAVIAPLRECRLLQSKLLGKLEGLGPNLEQEAEAEILTEEIVKTAAIEDEQVDAKAVRSSVAKRLGLPSAGTPVDRRIDDLVTVLCDATHNYDKPLTAERLWGWHAALFPSGYSGLEKIKTGGWRESNQPLRVFICPVRRKKINYEVPPSQALEKEMQGFLGWFAESRGKVEGIVRAGVAHLWFMMLHPFDDGNGRLARAITDMALAQAGRRRIRYCSFSSQIMTDRQSYCEILEKTRNGSCDITGWLIWFGKTFASALERSEEFMDGVWSKADFWQRYLGHRLSERQKTLINRLKYGASHISESGITTRQYASLHDCSRTAAFRELDQLCEVGLLHRVGQGRGARYELRSTI